MSREPVGWRKAKLPDHESQEFTLDEEWHRKQSALADVL